VDGYSKKALHAGIDYSAWPLVTHTLTARRVFGHAPRYVVGVSSEGADSMHVGYDLIGAAKSVLETLCRYLHYRLRTEGTSVNVVRTRFVDTVSLGDTMGDSFADFVRRYEPDVLTSAAEVANAIVGVCSGAMDALGGQVLTVDRGAGLYDNFSRLYQERHTRPVIPKEQP
jgi:enoyl-[acyl-carrier-protein] reductase (NADH)